MKGVVCIFEYCERLKIFLMYYTPVLCVWLWVSIDGRGRRSVKNSAMALPYVQGDKCCSMHLECLYGDRYAIIFFGRLLCIGSTVLGVLSGTGRFVQHLESA